VGGPQAWGLGVELTTHHKKVMCYEMFQSALAGFCEHGNEPVGSIKKAGHCLTG
jgi:hypothetical protein